MVPVKMNVMSDRDIQFESLKNTHIKAPISRLDRDFLKYSTFGTTLKGTRAIIFIICTPFEELMSVKVSGITLVEVMGKSLNHFKIN